MNPRCAHNDSQRPSLGREPESADQRVGGRSVDASTVGPTGGGANRDAIARPCPAPRAPRPCASLARFGTRRSKTAGRASELADARFTAVCCCRSARFSKNHPSGVFPSDQRILSKCA
jgi:hypothetical protein